VEGTLESQEGGTYGDPILCLKILVLLYIVYLVPEKKSMQPEVMKNPSMNAKRINCINNFQPMILWDRQR
jgi:hypothetical protein